MKRRASRQKGTRGVGREKIARFDSKGRVTIFSEGGMEKVSLLT